jgi:hypothetical protein
MTDRALALANRYDKAMEAYSQADVGSGTMTDRALALANRYLTV